MLLSRLQRAFAQVARLVAVAQFHRFVLAGGCAGGHGRAAHTAVGEINIRFHSRIAARIQNLSSNYFYDFHDDFLGPAGRMSVIMPADRWIQLFRLPDSAEDVR